MKKKEKEKAILTNDSEAVSERNTLKKRGSKTSSSLSDMVEVGTAREGRNGLASENEQTLFRQI